MNENRWLSDWFSKATSDDEPWMFYMTSAFVDHCLEMAEGCSASTTFAGSVNYSCRFTPCF